jgi:hypothetical protein
MVTCLREINMQAVIGITLIVLLYRDSDWPEQRGRGSRSVTTSVSDRVRVHLISLLLASSTYTLCELQSHVQYASLMQAYVGTASRDELVKHNSSKCRMLIVVQL